MAVKSFQSASGVKLRNENRFALCGLISEAKTFRNLKVHPNVMKYFGICTAKLRKVELKVVLEYCPNGSLNKFLTTMLNSADHERSFINNSTNETGSTGDMDTMLLKCCSEIANGFEYLISENVSRSITILH